MSKQKRKREKTIEEIAAEIEKEFGEDLEGLEEEPEPEKEEKKVIESGYEEIELTELNIWVPTTIGETILAKILEIREGSYGTEATMKVKGQEDEVITPAHKLLQNKIEQLQEGDIVKIVYQGRHVAGTGRKVHDYRVLRMVSSK